MNQTLQAVAVAALQRAIVTAGSRGRLARALGISRAAVSQWDVCPARRAAEVERITNVPRYELRPDLYDAPAAAA